MIRILGGIGLLRLTSGEYALIDAEDAELVQARRWQPHDTGTTVYVRATVKPKVYLHRLIMGFPAGEVDHRNRDSFDCRKANLRQATRHQQNINRSSPTPASGYRGVETLRSGRYRARIKYWGQMVRGAAIFADPIEAAREADALALRYFGQFAVLNFPDSLTTFGGVIGSAAQQVEIA
jgi:hypothetical protein